MRFTASMDGVTLAAVDADPIAETITPVLTAAEKQEVAYRNLMADLVAGFSAGDFPRAERECRLLLQNPYAQLLAWAAYQEGLKRN